MDQSMRDRVATVLVATATIIFVLWRIGVASGLSTSSVAIAILALGFLASASAVVPGFAALLRGSRRYLAAASALGLVALVAGALTVVNATEDTLAILTIATIVLWAAATVRHGAVVLPHLRPMG